MRYDYYCEGCKSEWEEQQFLNDRDLPLTKPCPQCKNSGQIKRGIFRAPHFSYAGSKSNLRRAGSGWNDVLQSIKKASGKKSTIETR
jgi:predicted nucleic acid-binding Zn ribbon protein